MNLTCNLYVDGEFEGTINSKKEVNIGKHGHIKGDVFTNRLVVQGFVEGMIDAEKVEIKADGRVKGTIESSELIIESKGIFEGNSILKSGTLHTKEVSKEQPKETTPFSGEKKTLETIKVPEPEPLKK